MAPVTLNASPMIQAMFSATGIDILCDAVRESVKVYNSLYRSGPHLHCASSPVCCSCTSSAIPSLVWIYSGSEREYADLTCDLDNIDEDTGSYTKCRLVFATPSRHGPQPGAPKFSCRIVVCSGAIWTEQELADLRPEHLSVLNDEEC